MASETALLTLENLSAAYGPVTIIRDLCLSVGRGSCLALLGANGAGKTTLLRAIAGLMVRRTGRIVFDGIDVIGLATHEMVTRGMTLVPEGRHLFGPLTVDENLGLGAYPLRQQGRRSEEQAARDLVFDLFPRLKERRRQHAATMSGGEQQMLAIARALMCRPKVLLLDEPTVGLAPRVIGEMFAALAELKRRDVTIIVAEQRVPPALALSDRVVVLRLGGIALDVRSRDLTDSDEIRSLYLGA